ncbi:MAG: methionine adenosyltransferase domain-containing protein [Chitinophagales bacterium]|nr:methionine adenosyltransferase domain-containing protein [Chitinophagales bacterium]
MPLALDLSHRILRQLSHIRKERHLMTYLRPDAKSQVTIEYSDDNKPLRIDTIVVSTQHDDFDRDDAMAQIIRNDIINIVIPEVKKQLSPELQNLFTSDIVYHINPTGKFVIGGPHGDTGLTGRKIIVDTYGGKGAHGGGAFSGKDPSKVDRSGAYATRHIAKNMVAAGVCSEVLVQVSYAIGIAEPTNVYVNTFGSAKVDMTDGQIADKIKTLFDLRPYKITKDLKLKSPIYSDTASYGHMGRTPEIKDVTFKDGSGNYKTLTVETFTWEKLDRVDDIRTAFGLK